MGEEYKPLVNQKKGYVPAGDQTASRVGELQTIRNNFAKTPVNVSPYKPKTPKPIVRVK